MHLLRLLLAGAFNFMSIENVGCVIGRALAVGSVFPNTATIRIADDDTLF